MTLQEHAQHLGELVSNFQSLEFVLRAVLQNLPSARPIGIPFGADIYSFSVGTELPENELTSFDSLGQLIDRYNDEAAKHAFQPLDRSLVAIRDALAHGRVSAAVPDDHLRLLKFSKPTNGRVQVTFNEALTATWFTEQKNRVRDAVLAVSANPLAQHLATGN